MTMSYEHLIFAQAQLDRARTQLEEALLRTEAQGYSPNWIAAIDLALGHNQETIRQVGNILTNIRTPQYERFIKSLEKEGAT